MKKNFWTWLLHDKKKEKSSICMKVCLCIAVFLACGAFRSVHAQTEKLTLKGKCLDVGHHFCRGETKQNDIRV